MIKRDYIIMLYTASKLNRCRISVPSSRMFYTSDRNSSNIYIICDEVTDYRLELLFNNTILEANQISDRQFEVEIPYDLLQDPKIYKAQLRLIKDDKMTTTDEFTITVKGSVTNARAK